MASLTFYYVISQKRVKIQPKNWGYVLVPVGPFNVHLQVQMCVNASIFFCRLTQFSLISGLKFA